MKKKFLSIVLAGMMLIILTGCGSDENNSSSQKSNSNSKYNNSEKGNSTNTKTETKKNPSLGDTITFDGLELTFDETYSFATLDNSFSEYNGMDVIRLGVNVKNVSNEKNSLNMFFYSLFGSKGVELDSVTAYFDDAIDYAGDLKPDASYTSYFYILYDGNGKYSIDFDNYSQEISVEFDVSK